MIDKRSLARALAAKAVAESRPLSWFEELYRKAADEGAKVPWADLVPNPHAIPLVERFSPNGAGRKALKVGCGYGDDSEWLASLGFEVTAFDISPTAIAECHRRFPDSPVEYLVADLFDAPSEWHNAFDLVWESYTLQVLPPDLRQKAIRTLPPLIASDGYLIVVARGRDEDEPEGLMPWPLTRQELNGFVCAGMAEIVFDDYIDQEEPPVRRFRACMKQKSAGNSVRLPPLSIPGLSTFDRKER